MDSNLQSPPSDNADVKTAFRKPLTDAANRKYRRHSPASRSPSSDGSLKLEHSSSPKFSNEDPGKVYEHRSRRKDDGRELDRDLERGRYGRSGDSYRNPDRQCPRKSHGYSRHDDYFRHDKHADEEERNYQRSPSQTGRESRGSAQSDHSKSRDLLRNVDKYSRDKYDGSGHKSKDKDRESSFLEHKKYRDKDPSSERAGSGRRHAHYEEIERDRHTTGLDCQDEKRDYRRRDYRSDRMLSHEESKGQGIDVISRRDDGNHRAKEGYKSEIKEADGENLAKEEKRKYDDQETNRSKDRYKREATEHSGDKCGFASEDQDSPVKRQKLFSLSKDVDGGKSVLKFTSAPDGRESYSSKQAQDGKLAAGLAQSDNSEAANDLNAAKVAAMKAAELVNKNLGGVGIMTADQKKKLLWGNKKNTTIEESGHHWDAALFSDRERQEKFNKLMGVKGDAKGENKPETQGGGDVVRAEKQKELQLDLEKQYTAGLRRRDGRTVGLGL